MNMNRHGSERKVAVFHVPDIAPGALVLNLVNGRVEVNGIEGVFADGPFKGQRGYRTMQSPNAKHKSAVVRVDKLGLALIGTLLGRSKVSENRAN